MFGKYETDLKPCPFCGKPPELRTSFGKLAVECFTRSCIRPSTYLNGPKTTNLKRIAKFWNNRITEPERIEIERQFADPVSVIEE